MDWREDARRGIEERFEPGREFTIEEVYAWEEELRSKFPHLKGDDLLNRMLREVDERDDSEPPLRP